MDTWQRADQVFTERFKEPVPWTDDAIDEKVIKERQYKASIQSLLQELLCHNYLSTHKSLVLYNLLVQYYRLKKTGSFHKAMNFQNHQITEIIDNLRLKQKYINDINVKRKQISSLANPKAELPMQVAKLEKKLTRDIDSIEPMNIVASIDTAIQPMTAQLEDETFDNILHNEDNGVLSSQIKELLISCIPTLPNECDNIKTKTQLANECINKCLNGEAIHLYNTDVIQYHFPTVPSNKL